MNALDGVPAETRFVEVLPELTRKGAKLLALLQALCLASVSADDLPPALHRAKGHRHVWAICDGCGQGTYVRSDNVGRSCRMVAGNVRQEWRAGERKPREIREPHCPGHHWPSGDSRATPPPPDGRCATCRRDAAVCVAEHRATGDRWLCCAKCRAQAERYRAPIAFRPLRVQEAA